LTEIYPTLQCLVADATTIRGDWVTPRVIHFRQFSPTLLPTLNRLWSKTRWTRGYYNYVPCIILEQLHLTPQHLPLGL